MENKADESPKGMIATLREKYSEQYIVRSAIQAIPSVGGTIDTLIAGRASQIQLERIEDFVKVLADRMAGVERVAADLNDEAFADLVLGTFEKVTRTRSHEKRIRFAEIIANQVARPASWEDPEDAVRLVSDLEDIHIEVLNTAVTARECTGSFSGLRVVSLKDRSADGSTEYEPIFLPDVFRQSGAAKLRMACAELVGKGLLRDEGLGRWDTKAMEFFAPTELADWLIEWITDQRRS